MSSLVAKLQHFYSDTIIAQRDSATNPFGDPDPIDGPIIIPCQIVISNRQVRLTAGGTTALSTVQALLNDDYELNATEYRFTIPDRYTPNGAEGAGAGLEAIAVDTIPDENGPCYQEVMLP